MSATREALKAIVEEMRGRVNFLMSQERFASGRDQEEMRWQARALGGYTAKLEFALSIPDGDGWIAVAEEMPKDETVLFAWDDGGMERGRFDGIDQSGHWIISGNTYYAPTHFMRVSPPSAKEGM